MHMLCCCPLNMAAIASVAYQVSRLAPRCSLQLKQRFCTRVKPEAHLEPARSRALSQLHAQHPHEGALVGAQQVVRHRDVPLQRVDLRPIAGIVAVY